MSAPTSYQLRIWRGEKSIFDTLRTEDKQRLKSILREIAKTENPYEHNNVGHLSGTSLLKVKVSDVRAIIRHEKPYVDVLLVGYRKNIYDKVSVAESRAEMA